MENFLDNQDNKSRNVLGEPLIVCCENPLTGFYRNGRCDTGPEDHGVHTVCVRATSDFLEYSASVGNDLRNSPKISLIIYPRIL